MYLTVGFVIIAAALLQISDITLGIRVHCRHTERIHEENIHHCCQHPDGHNDVTEKCAKETNFRLPSPNEEAIEDVTVDQVMSGTCWAKCVFDHFDLLHDRELNMTKVRAYYQRYHTSDPEYEKEMVNAYDHCHSKAETAAEDFLASPLIAAMNSDTMPCSPVSSIVMSCVVYNFFHNCPKNRWAHTAECEETLAFAKKCKDALTTM